MFELLTSLFYWVLVVLFALILALYLISRNQAKPFDRTATILLTVLSIDAFRTLFESLYFGLYFNSLYGFISPAVLEVLSQPHWVIVPKAVTLLTGLIILFILIRSWLPTSIREKREAEEKLMLAASVFINSREGIVIVSPEGKTLNVNDAFVALSGYTREELIGRTMSIHKSGEHPESFYTALWQSVQKYQSWSGQIWNRRKDGAVYPARLSVNTVFDELGCISTFVCLYTDITESVKQQQQLESIAHFDVLTGLPNRSLLSDRLSQAMQQSSRRGKSLAVLFLDLDGFKRVNDDFGNPVGDQVLVEVSTNIKKALRGVDTLSRFGGDEFVAVLPDLDELADCEPVLNRLLKAVREPMFIAGQNQELTASIGVTIHPTDHADAEQLIRHADQAMYEAKGKGGNCYQFFDASHEASLLENMRFQADILEGIACNQFVLYFQPIVALKTREVMGVEALIRWARPDGEFLEPSSFLAATASEVMASKLGEWVIEAALIQMEQWAEENITLPVSINIDGHHLQQKDFRDRFAVLLRNHPRVAPSSLELEVLETSALGSIDLVSKIMSDCKSLGVSFAIDDFGTGYSSLTYLRRLPAERIKVDQSFVRDMLEDPSDHSIVEGVISLAHAFDRVVIAEGVETEAHCDALLAMGCDLAQGYGIARPMPAEALPQWLHDWRSAKCGASNPVGEIPN